MVPANLQNLSLQADLFLRLRFWPFHIYCSQQQETDRQGERTEKSTEGVELRTMQGHKKKHKCSVNLIITALETS